MIHPGTLNEGGHGDDNVTVYVATKVMVNIAGKTYVTSSIHGCVYFTDSALNLSLSDLISKFGVHFPAGTDINKCFGVVYHTL